MLQDLRKVLPLRLQVASVFLFAMWLFFQAYQPWEPVDEDLLLESGHFNNATDLFGWSRESGQVSWSDDTGFVQLSQRSRLRFSLPVFNGDLLMASGRMMSTDLVAGGKPYQTGRMLLYFADSNGQIIWHHPHNIGDLPGPAEWLTFATVIEVPEQARKGWVELANHGQGGSVSFDDISVRPAVWKKAYKHWQMTFGMLWAAVMMWILLNTPLWRGLWGKALLAAGLLIIVGVTLPHEAVFQVASSGVSLTKKVLQEESAGREQSKPVSSAAPVSKDTSPQSAKVVVRSSGSNVQDNMAHELLSLGRDLTPNQFQKFGHQVLFSVLGFCAFMAFYGTISLSHLLYSLMLFAVSTEVLQLAVDGRHFLLSDLLIDLTGIIIGMLIALLFRFLQRRKQQGQSGTT